MITRTIAVGAATALPPGRVDLFLLPGEAPPPERAGLAVHAPRDLGEALIALRTEFSDHPSIVSLAGAQIIGSDPAWCAAFERRAAEFFQDLGNCALDSWKGARNAIGNSARIVTGSTTRELAGLLTGKPAICLGAGPSATPEALAHIAHLSRNHYVFACDSMMHACQVAGFAPQFVTMIERGAELARFVHGADPSSTLIAPAVVDPAATACFRRVCFWWAGCELYRWLGPEIAQTNLGRSAGTLSIAAAIAAGCDPIYLVGHDLAYAPGLVSHGPGVHAFALETQRTDDAKPITGATYNYERFDVPGNAGCPVTTNGLWNLFRGDIEYLVAQAEGRRILSAQGYAGAAIAGVPTASLPECGPPGRVAVVEIPSAGLRCPADRVPSLLEDAALVAERCAAMAAGIADSRADLTAAAHSLAPANLARGDNVDLFRYVFRSVYTALAVRLNLRLASDEQPREVQRKCLLLLCETLPALCARMREDLTA